MSDLARAQELKAEGNALFGKGEYDAASLKYGDAIRCDNRNAILYANRAACLIHMKRFVEAKGDAQKAVDLDPTYVKGLGRLAAAYNGLEEYEESLKYWKKAVNAFPEENLTAAELRHKEQCIIELQKVYNTVAQTGNLMAFSKEMQDRMPWDHAKALEQQLEAAFPDNQESSAWTLLRAAKLWDRGMEAMRSPEPRPNPDEGQYALSILADFTNAVLTEPRIFRLDQGALQWLNTYEALQKRAVRLYRAWPEVPVETIKREALRRQRTEGWDAARAALETTVRTNIMTGYLADKVAGSDPQIAIRRYDTAVEVLKWGTHDVWQDVSTAEKGELFSEWAIIATRRLRLEALRSACGDDPVHVPEDRLVRLYEEAQSMERETPDFDTLSEVDDEPGFLSAFGLYPKARALCMIGMYHQRRGYQCAQRAESIDMIDHFVESFGHFCVGAGAYPQDDEMHPCTVPGFLHVALQMTPMGASTFALVLELLEQLRSTAQKAAPIWGYYQATEGKDQVLATDLRLEQKIRKDLAEGKITLEDYIRPDYMQSFHESDMT